MSVENYQRRFYTSEKSSLSCRYERLLLSQNHTDCIFKIGCKEFRCHKLILSTASPVFETMFYGSIPEKETIEIRDMSARTFNMLINFVYTARIDFENESIEDIFELYYGAEKYFLNDLVEYCLNAVKFKLRFDNILPSLELSFRINLNPLLEMCTDFFTNFCLNDKQFMAYLKNNYFHVTKDCIKAIISYKKNLKLKYLIWFIFEWCQYECDYLGLKQNDFELIVHDLQIDMPKFKYDNQEICPHSQFKKMSNTIERCYYRACRPFKIDYNDCQWNITMRSDRFISLLGLVLQSRLKPSRWETSDPVVSSNEYKENLLIEIRVKIDSNNESKYEMILKHFVNNQQTNYNCYLNIIWDDAVVLSPDVEYQVRITWQANAFGAEYPLSLLSDEVDGIHFHDISHHIGSLIKGVKF